MILLANGNEHGRNQLFRLCLFSPSDQITFADSLLNSGGLG